jgi:hypothetical protein
MSLRFGEWDAWESDPPYGLGDDAVIELWWWQEEQTPVMRIALRHIPDDIDGRGLWWRRCD